MSPPPMKPESWDVFVALRSLDGRGTRGDLVLATGHSLAVIDAALHALMSDGHVEVTVSETAVLVYRLAPGRDDGPDPSSFPTTRWKGPARLAEPRRLRGPRRLLRPGRSGDSAPVIDRKTLRLIRAREGVVSIAELVEHTGLTVDETRREAERLAALYGGEPHPSWDGHIVYAFPELVASAHGELRVREPRPSWVWDEEPAGGPAPRPHRFSTAALVGAAPALAWFATNPPGPAGRIVVLAAVAGASAGAAFAAVEAVARIVRRHPRIRLRSEGTLRRHLLGYVFETALRGKGVVSLERAVAYLESRTGGLRPSRRKVDRVLQGLAAEFDATELTLGGDRFYGFRNVKRQFLASHVQRVRLRLQRKAAGSAVYDSGDTEESAAARELLLFDQDLRGGHGPLEDDEGSTPLRQPR